MRIVFETERKRGPAGREIDVLLALPTTAILNRWEGLPDHERQYIETFAARVAIAAGKDGSELTKQIARAVELYEQYNNERVSAEALTGLARRVFQGGHTTADACQLAAFALLSATGKLRFKSPIPGHEAEQPAAPVCHPDRRNPDAWDPITARLATMIEADKAIEVSGEAARQVMRQIGEALIEGARRG